MLVTCVTVYVKPEHVGDFIEATTKNHMNSVKEPGNMRFDILQCSDDQAKFMLYEAYESEEAAAVHKETEHYLKWKETVADWMARPREGVPHKVICPKERKGWL
jgi:autoinducer 2-degrading protein